MRKATLQLTCFAGTLLVATAWVADEAGARLKNLLALRSPINSVADSGKDASRTSDTKSPETRPADARSATVASGGTDGSVPFEAHEPLLLPESVAGMPAPGATMAPAAPLRLTDDYRPAPAEAGIGALLGLGGGSPMSAGGGAGSGSTTLPPNGKAFPVLIAAAPTVGQTTFPVDTTRQIAPFSNVGAGTPTVGSAVPEPSSLLLLIIFGLGLAADRPAKPRRTLKKTETTQSEE